MNAEAILDRLSTALHQAAISRTMPGSLAGAKVLNFSESFGLNATVTDHDLRTSFVVDLLAPRDVLAAQVDEAVLQLSHSIVSRLGAASRRGESHLVETRLHVIDAHEHPEPARIAPRIPALVGLDRDRGQWVATIRVPFGIATITPQ